MKKISFTLFFIAGSLMYLNAQDSLQQYTGKYHFPEGSVVREITVSLENNTLQVGSLIGTTVLVKEIEDSFSMHGLNATAIFKRNSNKKITNISLDVMGVKLEGHKEAEITAAQSGQTDKPIIIIWERKFLTTP